MLSNEDCIPLSPATKMIFRKGDIFTANTDYIVNPVNCVGVSGAGLAKQFAGKYKLPQDIYEACAKSGGMFIGKLIYVHPVIFFPTKKHWRDPSKMEYIEAGLKKFCETYQKNGVSSAAFPPLGCGLGGLKWENVRPLMLRYLEPLEIKIEVYQPNAHL
jgi:O-acetyl-ADP-ribose deacetylase (regulator of RNase III)